MHTWLLALAYASGCAGTEGGLAPTLPTAAFWEPNVTPLASTAAPEISDVEFEWPSLDFAAPYQPHSHGWRCGLRLPEPARGLWVMDDFDAVGYQPIQSIIDSVGGRRPVHVYHFRYVDGD